MIDGKVSATADSRAGLRVALTEQRYDEPRVISDTAIHLSVLYPETTVKYVFNKYGTQICLLEKNYLMAGRKIK